MTEERSGGVPSDVPDGLEGLTEDVLPALIARLRASRLEELEVRTPRWRVRLRRDRSAPLQTSVSAGGEAAAQSAAELDGSVARSPAVGYFMPAPTLSVGRSVQAGDLLGNVDVLGIAQEVIAPGDGIVSRVLAEDGQAVEFGQALADIDALELDFATDSGEEVEGA